MAKMRTPDGRWLVEIVTTRGGQTFRVHQPMRPPGPGSWGPHGRLCFTVAEVRELIGVEAFEQLTEVRAPRFD